MTGGNPNDSFMDHTSHFITFYDGTSPPADFARVEKPLRVILETHLFLEVQLIRLVERALPHPDQINLARYGFARLISLAAALGVISLDEKPGLVKFNLIRNKFAHDLNLDITQADILGVYNVLTPEEKEVAKGSSLPRELDRLVIHVACVLSVHFVAKSIEARNSA